MKKAYKRLGKEAQLAIEALDLVDTLEQARHDVQTMIETFGYEDFRPVYERLTYLVERASLRADRRAASAGMADSAT